MDFFSYWIHRSMHKVASLWRIHAVHHSSHHMDWLAASRVHVFELIVNRFVGYIPLLFMGFSPAATYAYLVFISFHAIFIHANVRFPFPLFSLAACNARVSSLASFLRKRGVRQKFCRLFTHL